MNLNYCVGCIRLAQDSVELRVEMGTNTTLRTA